MPAFPPGVCHIGGRNAAVTHARLAREYYTPLAPIVTELRREGLSLRQIARELDARGVLTRMQADAAAAGLVPSPARWDATQVRRVLLRAAELPTSAPEPLRWVRLDDYPRLLCLVAGSRLVGGHYPVTGSYRPRTAEGWGDTQPLPAYAPPLPVTQAAL